MDGGPNLSFRLRTLAARLENLSEWNQRAIVFGETFSAMAPEVASQAFSRIVTSTFGIRESGHKILAQSATLAMVASSWDREHRTHTREAAAGQGDEPTSVFLVTPEIPDDEDEDLEVPDYGAGRPLTLGERKSFATQPDRRILEMAMRDPHPRVASRVLDNPTLTENDVVRIAARRPQAPSVLAEIALHTRWRLRARVAMSLVNNPGMPPSTGLSLLPFLTVTDARQVCEDNKIVQSLKEGAACLLDHLEKMRKLSGRAAD